MPKEQGQTFCILCQEPLLFAQIYAHDEMAMFCNNSECPRFGLTTMVSTPMGKPKKQEPDEKTKIIKKS